MTEPITTRPWRGKPTPGIRLAVYRKSGFRCMRCNWEPTVPENYDGQYALWENGTSPKTGRQIVRILEIDHVVSYFHGGRYRAENLQALCNSCNASKRARAA